MTTSVFFNKGYKPEKSLYEDIIIEQIKAFGYDVYYLPRKLIKEDKLYGEDVLSEFNTAYTIEMYFDNNSLDSGDADALSKFGLEIRDEATFQVSKRRWDQLISTNLNLISSSRPNEGDLIYCQDFNRNKLFEISYVDETPTEKLGNIPVWTLGCRLFEYSHEAIDTGVPEIDIIEDVYSTNLINLYDFLLEDSSGELVLETGGNITQEAYSLESKDKSSVNEWIQIESDKIIDFTFSNPFGEP